MRFKVMYFDLFKRERPVHMEAEDLNALRKRIAASPKFKDSAKVEAYISDKEPYYLGVLRVYRSGVVWINMTLGSDNREQYVNVKTGKLTGNSPKVR